MFNISVFEYLNQKVMYIQDVNYYFGIKNDFDIKLGDYELEENQVLAIAKENDLEEYKVFIRTSVEERLNKIKTCDIEEIKEQSSYGQFTLCLHPSRKCNLNCKYCFRESKYLGDEQLTFKIAKDAIDFLVDKYAPYASKYVIDLSGSGEPLLQIDLVKQIVNYCKNKRNEVCKNIEVMFCTNLTLLTPELVDYLDNEPTIILGTSIDGDQITNDNNRVYANGKGTYDDIVKALKMFKNKKIGLAVTITPLNQDVDLIYDHLYHLPNVDCISMKFIRNFDSSKYGFSNFNVSYLLDRYEKLCINILEELEKGNFNYLKKLLQGGDYFGGVIYNNLFKGTYKIYRCDAGKTRIVVNNIGDIFACSVMYGNEDFKIGNIYKGIQIKKQSEFEVVSIKREIKCKDCIIRNICGGECYVNAYLKNNNLYKPIDKMCLIKMQLNKLSMSFISDIKNQFATIYKQLIEFACEISSYEITKVEIWALMSFLKLQKINPNYAEINEYIKKFDDVIEGMLSYLRKFNDISSLYEIYNEDIKVPAIAIANKLQLDQLNFVLVENISNGNVVFRDFSSISKTCLKLPVKEFIDNISNIVIC